MNETHHAVFVRGEINCDVSSLVPESEQYERSVERLGIDDVREITEEAHRTPTVAESKTIIVRTSFITLEAQNALLKVLEEPPATTQFVVVVPVDFYLLETIQSRVMVVYAAGGGEESVVFEEFMAENLAGRLSLIETAQKKKDTQWQRSMKTGLIEYLLTSTPKSQISELDFVSRWLLTRGASNKMLLEHLAMALPTR